CGAATVGGVSLTIRSPCHLVTLSPCHLVREVFPIPNSSPRRTLGLPPAGNHIAGSVSAQVLRYTCSRPLFREPFGSQSDFPQATDQEAVGMARRRHLVFVLFGFLSMGATQRTTNFVVTAPTPQIAQSVGQWAEYYRKEKAKLWLGKEMPNWSQPCP